MTKLLSDFHYTIAVKNCIESTKTDELQTIKNSLSEYLDSNIPTSASELLGLDKFEVPLLDNEPGWLRYYPWNSESISDIKKANIEWMLKHEYGLNLEPFGNNYTKDELIELESLRLFKLFKSIQVKGFITNHTFNSDIASQVLINNNLEYRWIVTGGHHRCAVCHALGHHEIKSRVEKIVFRSDVDEWPGVKSKLFSKKTALKVFDSIFQ